MSLSGQQRKILQKALIDAFPTKSSLEQMLSFELDKNLDVIASEGSLQDIVFKLIQTANAQGWVEDLVRAAYNSNPGNSRLRAIAEGLPNRAREIPLNIPQKQSNQPQKILILAAIPHGLRLDKEIREIEEAIRRATNRDLFEIKVRTAVRPQDIRRAIAEEQPQIVHFCGHGLEDGSLLLEDDGGNKKPVPPEGLASLFKLHAGYVKCVLLNACHSEKTASSISKYIDYAIGMNQSIEDKSAIEFAKGFYDGLGYKTSGNQDVFQRAFDEGMVAIELENVSQGSIPVLKKYEVSNIPVEETQIVNTKEQSCPYGIKIMQITPRTPNNSVTVYGTYDEKPPENVLRFYSLDNWGKYRPKEPEGLKNANFQETDGKKLWSFQINNLEQDAKILIVNAGEKTQASIKNFFKNGDATGEWVGTSELPTDATICDATSIVH